VGSVVGSGGDLIWGTGEGIRTGVGIGNGNSSLYSLQLMMHNECGGGMMHWNQGNHRPDSMHRHHGLVDHGGDDLDGCRMMNHVAAKGETERKCWGR